MSKNLVIVESPAKAKTIKKFLGNNYDVIASGGHVRDLPKSTLGVDIENDYEPHYITIRGKGDVLAALRKAAKKASKIYLATDPDREGEAISWHLKQLLKLDDSNSYRITFNEITKNAVKNSIKQARELNMNMVDSQQTRRILDRMVGYRISPLLWNKIKRGLSAGRVQSVTLRLVCDREEEIASFVREEYWSLTGIFSAEQGKKPLEAAYYGRNGKKNELKTQAEVDAVCEELAGKVGKVQEVRHAERRKKPALPFTTSTMQQEASRSLNFSTQKTMRIAQQLYEGVDIKGHGTIGLITYLRTDSTRISEEADRTAKEYILSQYGEAYLGTREEKKESDRRIQDAHEAIRPTYLELTPALVKEQLSREQFRLYQLIWRRFVASRMTDAIYETATVRIGVGEHEFHASTSAIKWEGYLSVYSDEDEKIGKQLGRLPEDGTEFAQTEYRKEQHFTQPPAHYTEASLVKTMEELGIGRPSTYATTITTLLTRRYVAKEGKNLFVTELGEAVNNMMKQAFPSIVEVDFTANLELLLDGVEDGSVPWKEIVRNFYPDLETAVKQAEESLESVKIADEVSEEVCENCGRNMVVKYGPHGRFLACPGFPECKNTKPYLEKIGVPCPKCGKELVIRRTRKGRKYFGCESYPECDYMSWQMPKTEEKT